MNFAKLLTKAASTYPDKPALMHGSKTLTFAQFNERANRVANALLGLGLSPGDNVAVLQYNYPETLETIFACFKAGCGAVPINFRLHPKECAYIIDHSQARAVALSPEFNRPIMDVRREMPDAEHFITLKGAEGELQDYESLLATASPELEDARVDPDQLAWLFYTSGTTGQPKGAMLTHRNLLAMTMNFYADISPLGPEDAILHGAPLSHGSGLYALPNIAKGVLNVILEGKAFDPELVFKTVERHRITNMFTAPTMVKRLAENPAADKYDHSSLRCLNYEGAPMYVEDLKQAMRTLGPCLVQLYGQGEAPMTIAYLPKRHHKLEGTPEQMRRLASAGITRTDVEVAVMDHEDRPLPTGRTGEIVTRSEQVMKGYWRNPRATAAALRNGWLYTGDVGRLDENGYLFIMDRSKDMITSGGKNIYPREVEEVLLRHPAVREVAVIGVPDPQWG